jgi:hypothetical protein
MTSYDKGRRWEHLARKELRDKGYTVMRAAGSKGAADLIAFDQVVIRIIQVKARAFSEADRNALLLLPAPPNATRETWRRVRGRWIIQRWRKSGGWLQT